MPRTAMVAIGIIALSVVTFAHPLEGNSYGFCPFKSPMHTANNVVVAAIDVAALWLIYLGIRR